MTVFRTHGNARRFTGARRGVMNFINRLRAFARNEEGQDLIEYALLVGLISLVAVAAVTAAGGSVNTIFTNIAARLASAA
jgi:pilus assembly protein Flp/PilA